MARRPRLRIAGVPQHVIQRGNNRQATFFAPEDQGFYLACLQHAARRHDCAIHAYVLMTNHVHLLVTPRRPEAISLVMRDVGRRYVQYINYTYRRNGTLAANLVAQEVPELARACRAETFFIPHSAMAEWAKGAEKSVMIDGCFLKCHGRALKKLVGEPKVVHIDALPLFKKYTDVFLMDDVPEEERKAVAREVADKIIAKLKQNAALLPTPCKSK